MDLRLAHRSYYVVGCGDPVMNGNKEKEENLIFMNKTENKNMKVNEGKQEERKQKERRIRRKIYIYCYMVQN